MRDSCSGKPDRGAPALGRVLRYLARIDVAAILILVVLLLAMLGSCFPQRPQSVKPDPDRMARWENSVRTRYDGLTRLLRAVGAFQWFGSPAFLLATGLLASAVLVCTLRRWRGVWRRTRRRPVRCSEAAFDRAAHAVELNAPSVAGIEGVVRDGLERRGFSVRSENDGHVTHVRGDRNGLAPAATLLTHVAVLALVLGAALSSVWGWREELTLAPGEAAEAGMESGWGSRPAWRSAGSSGLQVCNKGLTITRYADGRVAGYDAEVLLSEDGVEVMRGHIRLNQPLIYRDIAFTLQGYTSVDEGYSVTLWAVRDPGYNLVVAAGLLMLLGLTISFNLPQCCIHVRIEPEGGVRVAGRADRRAWGFEREFGALVGEIDRWADR